MIEWLIRPPVRTVDPDSAGHGSFIHSIDPTTGETSGQYTEITGYGVSLLVYLYRTLGDASFLDAAKDAAQFLQRTQASDGSYPHLPVPNRPERRGPSYTFDTAMCTMGLLDLHAVNPDPKILSSAKEAGDWLLEMQEESGAFKAAFDPERGMLDPGSFFGDGSCIHAKVAMALLRLADATDTVSYRRAAASVCDYVLSLQSSDGYFWANPAKNFVFTHAHCYACEGLAAAGAFLQKDVYTRAAERGLSWLRMVQNEDGSVFQVYEDRRAWRKRLPSLVNAQRASDATAQTARLIALFRDSRSPDFVRAVDFLTRRMQSSDGGLFYTQGRIRSDATLYAWPTMFAIQALVFSQFEASPKHLF